jgi:hypothetical protein
MIIVEFTFLSFVLALFSICMLTVLPMLFHTFTCKNYNAKTEELVIIKVFEYSIFLFSMLWTLISYVLSYDYDSINNDSLLVPMLFQLCVVVICYTNILKEVFVNNNINDSDNNSDSEYNYDSSIVAHA